MTVIILKQYFKNRRLLIDALAMMFGIGGLLGTNSIMVQLPVLINNAPEGWRLPTHVSMVMQLGNVGAILYSIYVKYAIRTRDNLMIGGFLGGATAVMFALALLHEQTSYIFGAERMTAVLCSSLFQSLVSSVAPILFMPYMRHFRDIYLVSYLMGEGLSGCLSSVLALIQGVGGNPECVTATDPNSTTQFVEYYPDPRFSTTIFFVVTGVLFSLSFMAFIGLSNISANSPERAKVESSAKPSSDETGTPVTSKTVDSEWNMPKKTYFYLMVIIWVISNFEYGIYASIQSYSCLPYGNVAYHLAVNLGYIANPLAMCLCVIFKKPKIYVISYLSAVIIVLTSFMTYLAVMSPAPPLQHTWIGVFMVVAVWIVLYGLIGFVRLSILTLFQPDFGLRLFYAGLVTLIGSLCGGVVSFWLVEFTKIFVTYSPCDNFIPN